MSKKESNKNPTFRRPKPPKNPPKIKHTTIRITLTKAHDEYNYKKPLHFFTLLLTNG